MAGLGTFLLSPDEAQESVYAALKEGYQLIDTANAYVNEEEVGEAIQESGIPREEIFLTTKVWWNITAITPVEPYTSDDLNWTNSSSRVSREHDDESLRDIALTEITPADWDSYDTVLIGYPIWWGIAAWPVDNFVKGNDFTGKTVIPFCTSSSSGLGDSGNLLEEMAGTGDWQEGHRFSSGASDADAADWVASLNLNE